MYVFIVMCGDYDSSTIAAIYDNYYMARVHASKLMKDKIGAESGPFEWKGAHSLKSIPKSPQIIYDKWISGADYVSIEGWSVTGKLAKRSPVDLPPGWYFD